MTNRELLQQALDALKNGKQVRAGEGGTKYQPDLEDTVIAALETALAQPEQEAFAPYTGAGEKSKIKHSLEPIAWIEELELNLREQSKFSDIVSDGGLDPRNKFDVQPKQEPVVQIRIKDGYWIDTPQSQVNHLTDGLHYLYEKERL